uniref:Uncharacterized protein n=1 Tax=Arundo donax TaxID=35708 RepID=A0A0A9FK28_ARUDO
MLDCYANLFLPLRRRFGPCAVTGRIFSARLRMERHM